MKTIRRITVLKLPALVFYGERDIPYNSSFRVVTSQTTKIDPKARSNNPEAAVDTGTVPITA